MASLLSVEMNFVVILLISIFKCRSSLQAPKLSVEHFKKQCIVSVIAFGSGLKAAELSAYAVEPSTTTSMYDKIASGYSSGNNGEAAKVLGVESLRAVAGREVTGDVLEVAIGTGLQSSFYDWMTIKSLTGIDESQEMLAEANTRLKSVAGSSHISLQPMDATMMSFADNSFDSAIDTFSLCVINEPEKAIMEMRRVTKPGASIVLLENGRSSSNKLIGNFQDLTEPLITASSKGKCRWNTDVSAIAAKAGFRAPPLLVEEEALGTLSLRVYKNDKTTDG